jgi:hypothetical protein
MSTGVVHPRAGHYLQQAGADAGVQHFGDPGAVSIRGLA